MAYVRKTLGPESFDTETVHTMDYLEYAYLQTAQDSEAKEVVDELTSFRRSAAPNLPTAYAVAAIPVRYALERRDWPAAALLSEPAIGFPLERFPWAEAMIAYARALGDARTGNIAGAETEIGRLQSLQDKLKGNDTYWANQVDLELNQPAAALVEYRAMLSTDPNRFRSLLGEARAAKQTGNSATAHDAYRKLVALSKPVGPARPELAEARSYLTN